MEGELAITVIATGFPIGKIEEEKSDASQINNMSVHRLAERARAHPAVESTHPKEMHRTIHHSKKEKEVNFT